MTKASAFLRLYLAATVALHFLAPMLLKRRLARGKEHPQRWREKLGEPSVARPKGRLVWMHAVGLGETLALRALIEQMAQDRTDQSFLVTSGTRASAEVFARNLPARTQHQFVPLDTPQAAKRFLDHWQPDVAIWAEQEIWPGLVYQADKRAIPLALVNARMDAQSYAKRRKARAIYADALGRFALISAQDAASQQHLTELGARQPVAIDGSLKPAAPALEAAPKDLERLSALMADHPSWLAASTHTEDETLVFATHNELPASYVTVLVPRVPERIEQILAKGHAAGCRLLTLSQAQQTSPAGHILIDDRFGSLGAWYRICPVALIGGSFGNVQGHNPWEAAALGCAILHGPFTQNFAADYAMLGNAKAALQVKDTGDLREAILRSDHNVRVAAAHSVVAGLVHKVAALGQRLNGL